MVKCQQTPLLVGDVAWACRWAASHCVFSRPLLFFFLPFIMIIIILIVALDLFSVCRWREGERASRERTLIPFDWAPPLTTYFNLHYAHKKALSPNTVTMELGASTYEFEGINIPSITARKKNQSNEMRGDAQKRSNNMVE